GHDSRGLSERRGSQGADCAGARWLVPWSRDATRERVGSAGRRHELPASGQGVAVRRRYDPRLVRVVRTWRRGGFDPLRDGRQFESDERRAGRGLEELGGDEPSALDARGRRLDREGIWARLRTPFRA